MTEPEQQRLSTNPSYVIGLGDGVMRQYQRDRIAAFGAIRRAAKVARAADKDAQTLFGLSSPYAAGCREAIRAAIGSEKV